MNEQQFSLTTLVDMAKSDHLLRFQRRWLERRTRRLNDDQEQAFYDELAVHLCACQNPEVARTAAMVFAATPGEPREAIFSLDPERLQEFLRVISQWLINDLPQIIDVIVRIIDLFAMVLLVIGLSGTLRANGVIAPGLPEPAAVMQETNIGLDVPHLRDSVRAPDQIKYVADYNRRWFNGDGLTLRQHAEHYHGLETDGLSWDQVAASNDADHDRYGGGHPSAMRAEKRVRQFVTAPIQVQNCPGGICPVPQRSHFVGVQPAQVSDLPPPVPAAALSGGLQLGIVAERRFTIARRILSGAPVIGRVLKALRPRTWSIPLRSCR